MGSIWKKILGIDQLSSLKPIVEKINEREKEIEKLTDEDIKSRFLKIKEELPDKNRDELLIEAFSLAREASKRTAGKRPFDVQLLSGIFLDRGSIIEMLTGEGKTLAAVAPAAFNALEGKGVHVVTVNEYLARRDAVWMGQIYRFLGLSVSCLVPNGAYLYDPDFQIPKEGEVLADQERDKTGNFLVQQEFLRPVSRREAYLADITYGTNQEFGFDYLRDNLAYSLEQQAQREPHFAIIDEVDSILIDEARTPLIIAAPDQQSSELYKTFARIISSLRKDEDYAVDEKFKSVSINDSGINKVEKMMGVSNIYSPENLRLTRFLEESLKAKELFRRDKDYVVKNGEIIIVDEFTGRMLFGRRYTGGLHQAIEAKEGVLVKDENRTYAQVSIQNYFRLYKKLAGMTGTAQTSAEEFSKVYKLEVVSIPTNKPMIRKDNSDLIYKDLKNKWQAITKEVKERNRKGQPVLIGTASIEHNEHLAALLSQEGISCEVLNAKNNEREGAIIAQAGKRGAVTVATNMAGRGVDIILGGNPPDAKEAEEVKNLGGLYVLGTERHDARRIDNQLRGRSGRQGDAGESQFFLSLEDDLMRIFGGEQIKGVMEKFNLPDDQPIQSGFVSKAVGQAQAKVEGFNFDTRKNLLDYDDVLNKQRTAFYKKRQEILNSLNKENLANIIFEAAAAYFESIKEQPFGELKKIFEAVGIVNKSRIWPENPDAESAKNILIKAGVETSMNPQAKNQLLSFMDFLWMNHLEDLESLREGIGLRSYGQKDPLVEYRKESHFLYNRIWDNFGQLVFQNIFKLAPFGANAEPSVPVAAKKQIQFPATAGKSGKVGRNDPCPCGSGKKYKRCHGA